MKNKNDEKYHPSSEFITHINGENLLKNSFLTGNPARGME